jgi:signal transduction histidine kinase
VPSESPLRGVRRAVGTVRFRVTALATLLTAAVLVVGAVLLVNEQQSQLTENLDDRLRQRANDVSALVRNEDLPDQLAGDTDEDLASQVVDQDGDVVVQSSIIKSDRPIATLPPDESSELRTFERVPVDDGPFRVLSRRVRAQGDDLVINVAGSLDDIHESTTSLESALRVAIPIVIVVFAALIWWLVGRTLRPVEAIRAEVARIGGKDLDHRVPQPPGENEIARLARTMNEMLDRLEDATRRQERFVADASHELRSPLTRIRSELEVDVAHPDRADLRETQRSLLEETVELQRLVDDLLYLAQTDAGAGVDVMTPVDLDDVVLRQARRLREDGRINVDISGVSAAQIEGDADQLNRAIRNLAENASRHARSQVAFTLAETGHTATLTVSDDGPGIPPDQRERVFERFTRLDESRTKDEGGTGLGLAITRDIIERHGGSIAIDPAHSPGTQFVITLPFAGHPRPPDLRRRARRPATSA